MCQPPESRCQPHSENLRVGRWSEKLACYAVTKNLARRQAILAAPSPAGIILSSLQHLRAAGEIRLSAFCIMPDHYHAVMFLVGSRSLSEVMGSLGKFTARRLNRLFGREGAFWEEGFYDHRCRDEDDIEDRTSYIEHNPVRAGLVATAADWEFSSAHPSNRLILDHDWYARVK